MFQAQVLKGSVFGTKLEQKMKQWQNASSKFHVRSLDEGNCKGSVSITESTLSR
mgnify:CR=1 FL=1